MKLKKPIATKAYRLQDHRDEDDYLRRGQMFSEAQRDMRLFQQKYSSLPELSYVISEMNRCL